MDEQHQIPIWFFVGAILLVYGVLIAGVGLWHWGNPPPVQLSEYHADVWWGALMTLVGTFYTVRYWPREAPAHAGEPQPLAGVGADPQRD